MKLLTAGFCAKEGQRMDGDEALLIVLSSFGIEIWRGTANI